MKQVFIVLIKIYQRYISPLKTTKCPYFPTCSKYGLEAIEKYGKNALAASDAVTDFNREFRSIYNDSGLGYYSTNEKRAESLRDKCLEKIDVKVELAVRKWLHERIIFRFAGGLAFYVPIERHSVLLAAPQHHAHQAERGKRR